MPIALGVILVAVLALGFMSIQAMLTRLNEEAASESRWAEVFAPLTSALGFLNKGQRWVWNQLVAVVSRAAGASIRALADWFWALEGLAADAARSVASLAETVADAFEHALTVTVPHAIKRAVTYEAGLRRIADEQLRRYARGIDRLVRDHVLPRVRAAEKAITVTIPREFQRAWARDRAIAGRIPHALTRRLSRLEKITTVVAIGGVVVRVLARRFPWLFCRKTNLIGKRLCGLDADLLDAVLLGTLVVWSGFSIVEAVKDLQKIEDEALAVMKSIIREL